MGRYFRMMGSKSAVQTVFSHFLFVGEPEQQMFPPLLFQNAKRQRAFLINTKSITF
jgi:hypothetical protein